MDGLWKSSEVSNFWKATGPSFCLHHHFSHFHQEHNNHHHSQTNNHPEKKTKRKWVGLPKKQLSLSPKKVPRFCLPIKICWCFGEKKKSVKIPNFLSLIVSKNNCTVSRGVSGGVGEVKKEVKWQTSKRKVVSSLLLKNDFDTRKRRERKLHSKKSTLYSGVSPFFFLLPKTSTDKKTKQKISSSRV